MDMSSYLESPETSSLIDETWINWFCCLRGNHVYCEVDKQFIEDSFNLFGLKNYITKDFNKVLYTILDRGNYDDEDQEEVEDLTKSAGLLYGLIHARYIITSAGLSAMQKKYLSAEFGECPRTNCEGQHVLPIGLSDEPNKGSYKLFCPKCRDLYNCSPTQRHIDGAFFGSTFAHIFLMSYEELVPVVSTRTFIPRIFGFKIHPSSSSIARQSMTGSSCSSSSTINMINSSYPQGNSNNNSSNAMIMMGHLLQGRLNSSTSVNSSADSKCSMHLQDIHADETIALALEHVTDPLREDYPFDDGVTALSVSRPITDSRSRFRIDIHNLSAIDDNEGPVNSNISVGLMTSNNSRPPDIDMMNTSSAVHHNNNNHIVELEEDKQDGRDDNDNDDDFIKGVDDGRPDNSEVVFKKSRIH